MPIPEEILAVERPKNTVVIVYGKNKNLYAVRQRIGCKNVNGRHLPVNGPTIGHIVDGKYIPIETDRPANASASGVACKDWANVMLCDKIFKDTLPELLAVYSHDDAISLYCIAVLRVCNPGIQNYELKEAYDASFLSEEYPEAELSEDSVFDLLHQLGWEQTKIACFMGSRMTNVSREHHLLVSGVSKSNAASVLSLSDFSKTRVKDCRDISVLYAIDLEEMEPVCSQCLLEIAPDGADFREFIAENQITGGLVVWGKGFPEVSNEQSGSNRNLHYLNPASGNEKLINRYNMLDFTGLLPGYDGIVFRKEKCTEANKWLYAFRDDQKAAVEAQIWLRQSQNDDNGHPETSRREQEEFGTIVLESDLDMPPEKIYQAYDRHCQAGIVMGSYKSACGEFDDMGAQDDCAVIGNEFCDFLSALLTFRLLKEFERINLLGKWTYKKIMSILERAKKVKTDGKNWTLIQLNPNYTEVLQALGLLPRREEPQKRKSGRPKESGKKIPEDESGKI